MAKQERKFRVDNFQAVERALAEMGAEPVKAREATHYYADQPVNDVVKLMVQAGGCRLLKLRESNGQFVATYRASVRDLAKGLQWLTAEGFQKVSILKMAYRDYLLGNGKVGLWTINDTLHSVILEFPEDRLSDVARELGLQAAEQITVPYNKYLEQRGELKLKDIATLMA